MENDTITLEEAIPVKILEWKHEPIEKFIGANESYVYYEVGLSKPNIFTSTFHFCVRVSLVYKNQFYGEVFHATGENEFRLAYRHNSPTGAFLFGLVDQATLEFAKVFHVRVQNTNLRFHKVPKPDFEDIKETLQEAIDRWDEPARRFKESGGVRLDRFKKLPVIPNHKLYNNKYPSTNEQRISFKLFNQQPLSKDEEEIIEELQAFYSELNQGLSLLDYTSFTTQDFLDFKNYFHYAFNFHFLITNELEVTDNLYRLVVNENVQGSDTSVTHRKYLTYPPLEVLKKISKYNRASTWNTTLLYLTESLDTALKETRPPKNRLVTVGVWKPKVDRTFTSYPIDYYEEAAKVNSEVAKGQSAIKMLSERQHPMLAKYMHNYLNMLAREYSKPISHHYEYLLSALLSENIFSIEDQNPDFDFDCIVYPSVGNNYKTRNLAVKPSIADRDFQLVKVIEFEVVQEHYDQAPVLTGNSASISVAKIINYRETDRIDENGYIEWDDFLLVK